jgi:hypothetical protein
MSEHEEFATLTENNYNQYIDKYSIDGTNSFVTHLELSAIITKFETIVFQQNELISKMQTDIDNLTLLVNGKQFMKRSLSYESVDIKSELDKVD